QDVPPLLLLIRTTRLEHVPEPATDPQLERDVGISRSPAPVPATPVPGRAPCCVRQHLLPAARVHFDPAEDRLAVDHDFTRSRESVDEPGQLVEIPIRVPGP